MFHRVLNALLLLTDFGIKRSGARLWTFYRQYLITLRLIILHVVRKVLAGNKLSEELENSLIEENNTTHISGQCRIATDCHQPKPYGSLIERLSG